MVSISGDQPAPVPVEVQMQSATASTSAGAKPPPPPPAPTPKGPTALPAWSGDIQFALVGCYASEPMTAAPVDSKFPFGWLSGHSGPLSLFLPATKLRLTKTALFGSGQIGDASLVCWYLCWLRLLRADELQRMPLRGRAVYSLFHCTRCGM